MSSIVLSYTTQDTSTAYSITFTQFLGNALPRQHLAQSAFNFSSRGTSIITGPSYIEKRIWTINTLLTRTQATYFETMYRQWDEDRSKGYPAALTIADSTFGSTVNTSVVISTAPTFNMINYNYWDTTLGLTEV